jgi:hypothetical protein
VSVRLLERGPLLDRMTERFRDTASRRHGHLLLLSGEAGAGKTTLLEAFRNEHRDTETFWGTCDGIVPPRPFAPIADVAASVGDPLQTALDVGDRDRVFEAFLVLLRGRPARSWCSTTSTGPTMRRLISCA